MSIGHQDEGVLTTNPEHALEQSGGIIQNSRLAQAANVKTDVHTDSVPFSCPSAQWSRAKASLFRETHPRPRSFEYSEAGTDILEIPGTVRKRRADRKDPS